MSKVLDYDTVSEDYDTCRSAVASHLYVGYLLTCLKKPLAEVSILDAGCGTGNYAAAMFEAGVGKISLLDDNLAMLQKAKQKLKPHSSVLDVTQHRLPNLPYANEQFDVVMFNNVLHHLDAGPDFPNVEKAMQEACRVLMRGGLLVIQHGFPRQTREGIWFHHLAPKAMERMLKRFIGRQELRKILREAGFCEPEIVVPTGTLIHRPDVFFNENGPLDPLFKKVDSFWGTLSPDEMLEVEARVTKLKEDGAMKAFIAEKDKDREDFGQISLIFAKKNM